VSDYYDIVRHLGIRQSVYAFFGRMAVLEAEFPQAQPDLVVFDDHPGQLTPGPLPHQTASPSSPAQCAGHCLLCSGAARHAHALVSQGDARTAARARVGTSRARAAAAGSTHHVVLGHQAPQHVRQQKKYRRLADARAAGANGQPARGRHAPRCAPADARSAGRGRGLAALPRPSQRRPAAALPRWLKIGTRRAARRRGPAHALWCCAQGHGKAACDALLVRFSARFSERQTRANFPPKKYLCLVLINAGSRTNTIIGTEY
jgi:hypothetical protein